MCVFVAANIYVTPPTLVIGCGIAGVGASILWCGNGAYLAECWDNATIGQFSGLVRKGSVVACP